MDASSIWWLLPILLVVAGIVIFNWPESPEFKGKVGESRVNSLIQRYLSPNRYCLIKGVTLPTIVVSRYGVFVIETKTMKGWIFGSVNQRTWIQKIYKRNFKFQNLLHQNQQLFLS